MSEQPLYEGKAKRIYETKKSAEWLVEYKDDATAFNGQKHSVLQGKGRLNNVISSILFEHLTEAGVHNHFIRKVSDVQQLVRPVNIIPLEVVVRNIAAGSLAKRLGYEEGKRLKHTVIEFYYKSDELGDPLLNEAHISELGLAESDTLEKIKQEALKVNQALVSYFDRRGIKLVDFKLEFGLDRETSDLILADEVSPDTCRLWDAKTNEKLDKDVFRRGLAELPEVYEKLLKRLGDVV